MKVGNQAVLQELAERIDQADAVVIGEAPACQARLDTTTTIGPRHFRKHWLPSRTVWLYLPTGWILPLLFQLWGTVGILQSIYPLHVGGPHGQPYLDLQALVADKPAFVLTTNWISSFFEYFPRNKFAPFRETLATANAVSLAGMIFGKTASW